MREKAKLYVKLDKMGAELDSYKLRLIENEIKAKRETLERLEISNARRIKTKLRRLKFIGDPKSFQEIINMLLSGKSPEFIKTFVILNKCFMTVFNRLQPMTPDLFTSDIKNVFKTMNVAYRDSVAQNNWSTVYANNYQPVIKATNVRQQVMPNVRGMGLKDAVYLLENMGLRVAVRGRGKITMQSVAPGTSLAKGITVILELS